MTNNGTPLKDLHFNDLVSILINLKTGDLSHIVKYEGDQNIHSYTISEK